MRFCVSLINVIVVLQVTVIWDIFKMPLMLSCFRKYLLRLYFRWHRGWACSGGVEEWLNMMFAFDDWKWRFLCALLAHLPFRSSNHCLTLLNMYNTCNDNRNIYYPHFEKWWLNMDTFLQSSNRMLSNYITQSTSETWTVLMNKFILGQNSGAQWWLRTLNIKFNHTWRH